MPIQGQFCQYIEGVYGKIVQLGHQIHRKTIIIILKIIPLKIIPLNDIYGGEFSCTVHVEAKHVPHLGFNLVLRARPSYPKKERGSGESCVSELFYWNAHQLLVVYAVFTQHASCEPTVHDRKQQRVQYGTAVQSSVQPVNCIQKQLESLHLCQQTRCSLQSNRQWLRLGERLG